MANTNPVKRTLDDVEEIGKYFNYLIVLVPSFAGALQNQNISSIWGLLALTAPFTVTVAVQTYRIMRHTAETFMGLLLSSFLLLFGLSLLSRWIGIGTSIDVGNLLLPHQQDSMARMLNHFPGAMGTLLAYLWEMLEGYFELYKPLTFCASVGCGIYLGYRFAKREEKKEKAAEEIKKVATGAA